MLATVLGSVAFAAPSTILYGKVVYVADGDTFSILLRGREIFVSLAGADAPELDQPGGAQSRKQLGSLVFDRHVEVVEVGAGSTPKEVLARVYLGGFDSGLDVNAEMVRRGYAWASPEFGAEHLYRLESEARTARRGLWKSTAHVPPWQWRAGVRAARR